MATIQLLSSSLGNGLSTLLTCTDILPGDDPSYQLCKTIYLYHPVGQKMAESPIKMAQFLPREISVSEGPEDDVKAAFLKQWEDDGATAIIRNVGSQARVYGIASLALLVEGEKPAAPLEANKLADAEIAFNVLDPLNTSGSLVLSQDPNDMNFQKHRDISVQGVTYHRSRTVTVMNEAPIYIAYTSAAFGFVGRSVYQRALYPLKSFVQTMIADDMVARKVGLIVAMLKTAGSIVDAIMNAAAAFKRQLLKVAATDNVISIDKDEQVNSLDLTNLDGPLALVRKDILENIAAAADMPAKLLNAETFAEGFGEGTEDAKAVAAYVDGIREWLKPLYKFMDMVIQRRAWNPRFYAYIKNKYKDEYENVSYEDAFYRWQNSFKAQWPSLLREPESEQIRIADVKLKAVIAAFQILKPEVKDPENAIRLIEWVEDQLNGTRELFGAPLNLDYGDELRAVEEAKASGGEGSDGEEGGLAEPKPNKPFAANDSAGSSGVAAWLSAPREEHVYGLRRRIDAIEKHLRRVA